MTEKHEVRPEENVEELTMRTIDLEFLSLASYTRLCILISICLGFAAGLFVFVLDILGVDTSVHIGLFHIFNTEAGVVSIFVGPFIFAVVGFVGSLMTYKLFLWSLRTFWGLALTGRWKDISARGSGKR